VDGRNVTEAARINTSGVSYELTGLESGDVRTVEIRVVDNAGLATSRTVTVSAGSTDARLGDYSALGGVTVDDGRAYVVSDDEILGIDLSTNRTVVRFSAPSGYPTDLAYGDDSLWFADSGLDSFDGGIVELNPETGAVRERYSFGWDPTGLAYNDGSLWVVDVTSNRIIEYGPNLNRRSEFDVGATTEGRSLAYANGSLWVVDRGRALYEYSTDGTLLGTTRLEDASYRSLGGTETALYGPDENGNLSVLRRFVDSRSELNVTTLSAPTNVTEGEVITIESIVTNTGEDAVTAGETTFRLDLNDDGDLSASETLGTRTVDLAAGESTTVTFNINTTGLDDGTYTHGVVTADDRRTAALTIESNQTSGIIVSTEPSTDTLDPGETATFDFVAEEADEGIGSYGFDVTTNDTSTVAIESVSLNGNPALYSVSVADDNGSASVRTSAVENTGISTLATVTVTASGGGSAMLSLSGVEIGYDDGSDDYNIGPINASTIDVDGGSVGRTATVVLDGAPNGVGAYELTIGTTGSSATIESLEGNSNVAVSETTAGGVGESSVTYRALFQSFDPTSEEVVLLTAEFSEPVSRDDLELSNLDIRDPDSNDIPASRVSISIEATDPFPNGIPGVSGRPPTDLNGDAQYEDLNGDGERTLDDAFALAFGPLQQAEDLSDAQVKALDFDGDGELTLNDAFALAFGS
jgi:hypothetical protein